MSDILFVCVHNAGRSQMAKALFDQAANERGLALRAESAGTSVADHVHANVVEVMRELQLELSDAKPKVITDEMVVKAQRVITMGCSVDADACPALFITDVEDWGIPDPAGRSIEETRVIRDTIVEKVENLVDMMV